MKNRKKIGLVGAGNIGNILAMLSAIKNMGDVVIFDIVEDMPSGKALDLAQAGCVELFDNDIKGSNDYKDLQDSDVIIISAGLPRKPGMSRDDLLATNAGIIKSIATAVKEYAPDAFVIVITNPLDAMVYAFQQYSGLPHTKVVGMAGVLDSARMKNFLAKELNVSVRDVQTTVLGGHGDSMVPLINYCTVSGIPLPQLIAMGWITKERVEQIFQRTREGGAEIVKLLKNGSAFFAPASSALEMAESYLHDFKRLLPCAAYLQGEYGISGKYIGVPIIIGARGVEKVVELSLSDDEARMLKESEAGVDDLMKALAKMDL